MEDEQSSGASVEPVSGASMATAQKHEAPSASGASNLQLSKRRRGLGVVTPNACTECRKKRAKCDGKKPCSRCKSQKDVECVYEVPVRQSKENLRHEIEALRQQQRQNDNVLSALTRPEHWEDVLQRLRHGQSVEGISEWLNGAGGAPLPSFAQPSEPRSGVSLSALSTYGGTHAGAGGYASQMGMSPATGHAKQDFDPNSPWNFSSQSQTVSTGSESHPDAMQWTGEGHPGSRVGTWLQDQDKSPTSPDRYRGVEQIIATTDPTDMKMPAGAWTNVTRDSVLVQHLLALYFCWEYPTFASFSKEHFLKDFLCGRHRYCSPILVNALLALGCRFSTRPNTRGNPNEPRTAGDHFFKEALRLFYQETNHHTLTTIQALGIMSIREASCGRDSESWYYAGQSVRLAIEMGLHQPHDNGDEEEVAVQAATFWGAFALDHAWSLATGSLPQCSCFPHLPPKPAIIDDVEASLWIPYTDDGRLNQSDLLPLANHQTRPLSLRLGAPLQHSYEQPSNVHSVYKCFCELSELVHQSLYVLHSPGRPVTSRDLLNIYTQYLNWYDRVPEALRLGHNFTPAVLFAHMYYHFAILLLFRPLIKLRIIGSNLLPRDVCTQAADAIQGLLRSYSSLYTLRRTPSFVPYFVLTSTIMHLAMAGGTPDGGSPGANSDPSTARQDGSEAGNLRPPTSSTGTDESQPTSPTTTPTANLGPKVAKALNQGIADLAEMAPCHHFAQQALNILRYLAKKWNIDVIIDSPSTGTQEEHDKSVRPATHSLNFFAPHVIEADFVCGWGAKAATGPVDFQEQANTPKKRPDVSRSDQMEGVVAEGGDLAAVAPAPEPVPEIGHGAGQGPMPNSAKTTENPLFWPFPMQGRPMLPEGPELEDAGFSPL